jgi:hypothetical protein
MPRGGRSPTELPPQRAAPQSQGLLRRRRNERLLCPGGGHQCRSSRTHNPFVSIRWLLEGKVIDGTPIRRRQSRRTAKNRSTCVRSVRHGSGSSRLVRPHRFEGARPRMRHGERPIESEWSPGAKVMGTDCPHVRIRDRHNAVEDIVLRAGIRARNHRPDAVTQVFDQRVLGKVFLVVCIALMDRYNRVQCQCLQAEAASK